MPMGQTKSGHRRALNSDFPPPELPAGSRTICFRLLSVGFAFTRVACRRRRSFCLSRDDSRSSKSTSLDIDRGRPRRSGGAASILALGHFLMGSSFMDWKVEGVMANHHEVLVVGMGHAFKCVPVSSNLFKPPAPWKQSPAQAESRGRATEKPSLDLTNTVVRRKVRDG